MKGREAQSQLPREDRGVRRNGPRRRASRLCELSEKPSRAQNGPRHPEIGEQQSRTFNHVAACTSPPDTHLYQENRKNDRMFENGLQ